LNNGATPVLARPSGLPERCFLHKIGLIPLQLGHERTEDGEDVVSPGRLTWSRYPRSSSEAANTWLTAASPASHAGTQLVLTQSGWMPDRAQVWWPVGCTFLIPGAPKCGTSTLYAHLSGHPDVCMSDRKEPSFFHEHFGDSAYVEECFRHRRDERIFGEATVTYMVHPQVPRRIQATIPDAKFIIALREPVTRAISQYEYRVQTAREVRPFSEIIKLGLTDEILSFSAYGTHFGRFFALFPMERFHFVPISDLASDPTGTMARVFSFLGVDPIAITQVVQRNVTRAVGSVATRRVLFQIQRTGVHRLVPRTLRPPTRRLLRRLVRLGSSNLRTEIDRGDLARLIEMFEPEVESFERSTGLSFPSWRAAWAAFAR
jgi:hypothetical protein